MKKVLFLNLLFLITFSYSIEINSSGHIKREKLSYRTYTKDGEFYISYQGRTYIGTSLHPVTNGYVTLTTIEENIPTTIRIYRGEELILKESFPKVINISFSTNGDFFAFCTGNEIISYNILAGKRKTNEQAYFFSISNEGDIAYNIDQNTIKFKNVSTNLSSSVKKIDMLNNQPIIFCENEIYLINNGEVLSIQKLENSYFDHLIHNRNVYVVEKKKTKDQIQFSLYQVKEKKRLIETKKIDLPRSHTNIHAPLNYEESNYPYPIGNSYGEIQQYGGEPYLHPGVDFLGDDYQNVYAVESGFIKAILTTGGAPYWRIAIAPEDTEEEQEGYLYAHINEESIPYTIGDYVEEGDLIGTLYPWNYYDFTHIHFSRIRSEGNIWQGNWLTPDNAQIDVTTLQDTLPPVFENTFDNDLFAFRDEDDYLNPDNLSGSFDIISKCFDLCNSEWKIDIYDLSFSISSVINPDSVLFEQFSFAFDMPIDTYYDDDLTMLALNTIYSRDAVCYSLGDYENREYYHMITNSNGDSLITIEDEVYSFDSSQFPDGEYWLKVTAHDASMNEASAQMQVQFNNGNTSTSQNHLLPSMIVTNHPNPFNPSTTFSFDLPESSDYQFSIYNCRGQKIFYKVEMCSDSELNKKIIWNAKKQASGIYFYRLQTNHNVTSGKCLLVK